MVGAVATFPLERPGMNYRAIARSSVLRMPQRETLRAAHLQGSMPVQVAMRCPLTILLVVGVNSDQFASFLPYLAIVDAFGDSCEQLSLIRLTEAPCARNRSRNPRLTLTSLVPMDVTGLDS